MSGQMSQDRSEFADFADGIVVHQGNADDTVLQG